MENPFEIIDAKLDRIIHLLELLKSNENKGQGNIDSEIMNIEQLASFIGCSKYTVYGYTSSRSIPHFKKNKRLFFRRTDIVKWITDAKVKTREEIEQEAITYLTTKHKRRN